jgi:hypothetical protein
MISVIKTTIKGGREIRTKIDINQAVVELSKKYEKSQPHKIRQCLLRGSKMGSPTLGGTFQILKKKEEKEMSNKEEVKKAKVIPAEEPDPKEEEITLKGSDYKKVKTTKSKEDPKEEEVRMIKKKSAQPKQLQHKKGPNTIDIKDLAKELKTRPKELRAKLRKMKIQKPGRFWEWDKTKDKEVVDNIRKQLTTE